MLVLTGFGLLKRVRERVVDTTRQRRDKGGGEGEQDREAKSCVMMVMRCRS